MEGSVTGPRLTGNLRLTNLASARPDRVSTPAMRGVLTTEDRASVWVELDGLAISSELRGLAEVGVPA